MVDKLHNFRLMSLIIIIPVLFSCATTQQKQTELKYAEAYSNRGNAYYFKREYEKSWKDVEKAQSLGYQIHPEFLEELRKASGKEK